MNYIEMDDNLFLNVLIKIYGLDYIKTKYLEILSQKKNKNFSNIIEVGTFMHVTKRVSERLGDIYNSWDQLYQVSYLVAVGPNSNIKNGMVLMKDKIKTLVANNELVIIKENLKITDLDIVLYESLEKMPCEGFSILKKEFPKEKILAEIESNHLKRSLK